MELKPSTFEYLELDWWKEPGKNENSKELHFVAQGIISIAPAAFDSFKFLQELSLWENGISVLPPGIFRNLPELRKIYLYMNKIKELDRDIFKYNKKLKYIWVNNNELTHIADEVFADLPDLEELNISTNELKNFNFKCLLTSRKLTHLSFADNKLTEINECENFRQFFPNLVECAIDGNNFFRTYVVAIIKSFASQNINILGLDTSKGIEGVSVYGLLCIPDELITKGLALDVLS